MRCRRPSLLALSLWAGVAAAAPPADLSGEWRLNVELSDPPPAEAPGQGRGGPFEGRRPRGDGPPPMGGGRGFGREGGPGGSPPGGRAPRHGEQGPDDARPDMPPAARTLTLAVDDQWFTLTGDDGRPRRFVIGGSTSTPLGGTTRTEWEGQQLVLRGGGEPPLTRRLSLTPDGRRLLLVVESETPDGDPIRRSRIYDRAETEE